MNSIRRIQVCVFVLGLLTASARGDALPNVVLILGDDQAWTDFGFMGHETIRTPNLDRLALQGAVFPRSYVPTSLCRPSLATILSGLYPHQHGITGNDPPRGVDRGVMLKHVERMPSLRLRRVTRSVNSAQLRTRHGCPAVGDDSKMVLRAEASPVSCPCQYGELADSASNMCT